ncbi:MAG: hypothetical protein HKN68_17195 [Saprospiraceae bacterium]|nr:hypothetical protein [Saprospiraceae bacterium]
MIRILYIALFSLSIFTFFSSCKENEESNKRPHIVFVIGDEEYRSEESMPMLGQLLQKCFDVEVSYCHSVDSTGTIDPNRLDHIEGLQALESADLMVIFTRFRALPDEELQHIIDYAESGRPMVGFRTSTHAFLYKDDSSKFHMNNEWPSKVFGQQWITHHGHFDDGTIPLTEVTINKNEFEHPILHGIKDFEAFSWLYHVEGGKWNLHGDSQPLLSGKALKSNHEMNDRLAEFPLNNPVAWIKSYTGESGKPARVFFTTLGHPFDFKEQNMRKLSIQGILWALGQENQIPDQGIDYNLDIEYDPNNSGFGKKYKRGLKPIK